MSMLFWQPYQGSKTSTKPVDWFFSYLISHLCSMATTFPTDEYHIYSGNVYYLIILNCSGTNFVWLEVLKVVLEGLKLPTLEMLGMSKIMRTQNLGVPRWRSTSCATIGPETCLHSLTPKPYIHPPLPYGGKFWVAQLRHPGFFGLRNV